MTSSKHHGPYHSESTHQHKSEAPKSIDVAVVTVSDTRTLDTDTGGAQIVELLEAAGHRVVSREIVKDDVLEISGALRRQLVAEQARVVIFTGGTGLSPRDVTPEALEPLLDRVVPGFGEMFRMLSYAEIGSAAMMSRAVAGLASGRCVFAVPGSRAAVKLAMEKLILPEMGHLIVESQKKGGAKPV